jgi:hypothetical protein
MCFDLNHPRLVLDFTERKAHDVKAFFDKVQKMYTMKDMGNTFMEETGDLLTLNTKIIAHPSVAEMGSARRNTTGLSLLVFVPKR